jgi:hypothetical protein
MNNISSKPKKSYFTKTKMNKTLTGDNTLMGIILLAAISEIHIGRIYS